MAQPSTISITDSTPSYTRSVHKERVVLLLLAASLIVGIFLSLTIGRYAIPAGQIIEIIYQFFSADGVSAANHQASVVLFIVRIPRILLAIMVGAGMAVAGTAYQGLFRNPMASPEILGASDGAATGAVISLLLGFSSGIMQLLSFIFGIAAVSLVLLVTKFVGQGRGSNSLLIMVLTGTVVSRIFTAIISLAKYLADTQDKLPSITFWLMGSFARSGNTRSMIIMGLALLIGVLPLILLRYKMNVLSFGDEEARSMGVDTSKMRLVIIGCATLLTSVAVSLCGIISWVGLIVPHICRFFVGPNHRALLPTSLLAGGLFMLIVDNFARGLTLGELPISVLTSVIGAPLFLYMIFRERRRLL